MPVVWAANLLGERLRDRVYGPELMLRYNDRCARLGHRVWLYGGRDQGSLVQLALSMRRRHPGIKVMGGYSPPFRPLTGEEEADIASEINAARPDVLWVGIGVPKQEKWMARMRERLDVPVMCGVGAAFDFHAGRVSMAPRWMQEQGLEWVYRTAQSRGGCCHATSHEPALRRRLCPPVSGRTAPSPRVDWPRWHRASP